MSQSPRLAACLLLTLVRCSGGGGGPDAAVDMTPPPAAALLAARPYSVVVPPGYTPARRWPLLVVLAGAGDHATDIARYSGLTQLAADQGLLLATPDPDPLQFRLNWDPSPVHYPNFDVEYLTAVIHDLESRYAIDGGQVFVAGHSLGAHMAHRLACDDSADVAAILSLAGQVSKIPSECAPQRPVSVLQVHGTADDIIGYNGDVQHDPPDPEIPSAHETVGVWARNDHCSGALVETQRRLDLDIGLSGSETVVEAYTGCPGGQVDGGTAPVGVELWSIEGGGHVPDLTPQFAGLVWSFLSAHARAPLTPP